MSLDLVSDWSGWRVLGSTDPPTQRPVMYSTISALGTSTEVSIKNRTTVLQ
jgi:hypothetical protein